jgi:hypothetical protein
VGDGAVHLLLDVYDELSRDGLPVRTSRSSITHSNFMSKEAVDQAARLGVMLDIQPVWLYLDGHTLAKHFGIDRLRYFQPLHSLFAAGVNAGGGSDHMQKIGSLRSVNLYNPFVGIATAVTRRARNYESPIHPEEALTREEAIRFYTINNARLLHKEERTGSLEVGKLADMSCSIPICLLVLTTRSSIRRSCAPTWVESSCTKAPSHRSGGSNAPGHSQTGRVSLACFPPHPRSRAQAPLPCAICINLGDRSAAIAPFTRGSTISALSTS